MTELVTILIEDETTILELPDGAKMEPLSPSREDAYCVIRGTIPPGLSVPLHSHQDAESFYVLSGEAKALVQTKGGLNGKCSGQETSSTSLVERSTRGAMFLAHR